MSDERQSNNTKIAILLIAPVIAGLALLALRPKEVEQRPVAEPPKLVVQKEPEPVVPVKEAIPEVVPEELDAARETLLGTNKQQVVAKVEQAPPRNERRRPKVKRPMREETTETVEEVYEQREESGDGLSDQKFRETIEAWRGMKSCVETSKTRTTATNGALRMSLKINGNGEVLKGRVFDESNEAARKVGRCVEKQLASLKFPSFETRDPAITKEAKFVF